MNDEKVLLYGTPSYEETIELRYKSKSFVNGNRGKKGTSDDLITKSYAARKLEKGKMSFELNSCNFSGSEIATPTCSSPSMVKQLYRSFTLISSYIPGHCK